MIFSKWSVPVHVACEKPVSVLAFDKLLIQTTDVSYSIWQTEDGDPQNRYNRLLLFAPGKLTEFLFRNWLEVQRAP